MYETFHQFGIPYSASLSYTIQKRKSIWKLLKFYRIKKKIFCLFSLPLRNDKKVLKLKNNCLQLFPFMLICIW